MERLGDWEIGPADGGGTDVVILAPELPPAGMVKNARKKGIRAELPFLPEGLEPHGSYSKLLVRTALIRPESYAPSIVRPKIGGPEDAAEAVRHASFFDQEHVITLALDSNGRISAIHEAHIGTMSSAYAQTRHVLKVALLVGAAAAIIFHNHPSGDPTPSDEDGTLTGAVIAAGQLLGIPVLDHIVVADRGYASFDTHRIFDWDGQILGRVPPGPIAAMANQLDELRWTAGKEGARAQERAFGWGGRAARERLGAR